VVRFVREPHERVPSDGFDLLMRRDNVQDIEVYLAMYDMQDLRDWLYTHGRPYSLNLFFHAWLFPELAYRSEAGSSVEAAIFDCSGVFAVSDAGGLSKVLRAYDQRVWVKDKVYMCMGPDCMKLRIDRHRLVCTFWSICIPVGEERAIATKHVLLNETRTHITREVSLACAELGDASISNVLNHLQRLLTTVANATNRLSKFMGRCEGAFDNIFLDMPDDYAPHPAKSSSQSHADPMEVWEEQLNLLDRTVRDGQSSAARPAPLLSTMIRHRVYEDLGRRRRKGKVPPDDEEAIQLGEKAFLKTTGSERAQAVHRVLIECIHDLERLSESNAEMLAVEGVTA